jgi:transcriptional regulator with AAA-type ATPase domain
VSDSTINDLTSPDDEAPCDGAALVVTWCPDDPGRVGEVVLLPDAQANLTTTLGRGEVDELMLRCTFVRQRPGRNERQPPLTNRRISRSQLTLRAEGDRELRVENVGRCSMSHNDIESRSALLRPGDTVTLRNALQLLCVVRPAVMPTYDRLPREGWPDFGGPDAHGAVGESPAAWALRNRVVFVANRSPHALITGASGSGKELVARAIHALSDRASRPMISRNAATIPEGLIDAELFGNVSDYPNPGMRDRRGLFGEANRSTLFLDEIAEVPQAIQAHLLRALDEGEIHRLGESRPQRVDVRVLGATNRHPSALKHDLLARFKLRIDVPDLNARREDVPLLVRHLLQNLAKEDPEVRERFFGGSEPRLTARLMGRLVRRQFRTHVRELEVILWQSIASSPSNSLDWTPAMNEGVAGGAEEPQIAPTVRVEDLLPADIQTALDANNGRVKETWQALGLKNRFQLIRLIKKYALKK